MGAVDFSIDIQLIQHLKQVLPLSIFVETGTFDGESVHRARPFFEKLYTVELSADYYARAAARFKGDQAVEVCYDNSVEFLRKISSALKDKSVLYWLDAHWCVADKTVGKKSQCPVLQELAAIQHLDSRSVVLIDDARLFLCPPPKPHEISQWPSFDALIKGLHALSSDHKTMVMNDTVIYFPNTINDTLKTFAYEHSIDWLSVLDKSRNYDLLLVQLEEKETEIRSLAVAAQEKEAENDQLVVQLEEKETEIRSLAVVAQEKEAEITRLSDVMGELYQSPVYRAAIRIGRFNQWIMPKSLWGKIDLLGRLYRFFEPRLGVLSHYPPKPLKTPKRYVSVRPSIESLVMSIVTPSFNQAAYLEQTIKSVLEQNYPTLDYIVQDGGSSDSTLQVLERCGDDLAHWVSAKDRGQANAINLGFAHSTGEIMAWLNSDDLLLPGTLNYVARFFVAHPEVDVVYGHRVLIDENGQEIGRWVLPPHDDHILHWADYIPQETLFWRRRIWEKAGGYVDENYQFALDWDLLLRFQAAGAKMARLPRFLGAFRVHAAQKTSAQLGELGWQEMDRLRERCHGRRVSRAEIGVHIGPYLARSVIYHKFYRLGVLRY